MSNSKKISSSKSQSPKHNNVQSNISTNNNNSNVLETHGDYTLRTDGVYKKEDKNEFKICGFLRVDALFRDGTSDDWNKLVEFKDVDGVDHQELIPNTAFLSHYRVILEPLVKAGLAVGVPSEVTSYLKTVNPQKRGRIAYKLGWHNFDGKACFVLPSDQSIGSTNEKVMYEGTSSMSAIASKGTLQEWQEHIAIPACSSSRAVLAISTAFASPLVSLGNRNNAGFHFRGNSSSGKSVAQAIGCSVIASPDYKLTWRSTANGLEAIALAHNDLMLPLDEISQADPSSVSTSIYDLMNGKQKVRANKTGTAQEVQSWNTLVLSSGEESLKDIAFSQGKKTKAGEEIRLADIPADAGAGLGANESIPDGFNSIQEYGEHMRKAVANYYGTPFVAFMNQLITLDPVSLQQDLSTYIAGFVKEVTPNGTSQVKRVAESFALVAYAGELATYYNITGWKEGVAENAVIVCFKAWLDEFDTGRPKEEQDLIDNALSILTQKQAGFSPLNEARVPPEHIGWFSDNNQQQEFLVYAQSYKKFFCLGKSTTLVNSVLRKAGILVDEKYTANPKSRFGRSTKVKKLVMPEEK